MRSRCFHRWPACQIGSSERGLGIVIRTSSRGRSRRIGRADLASARRSRVKTNLQKRRFLQAVRRPRFSKTFAKVMGYVDRKGPVLGADPACDPGAVQ